MHYELMQMHDQGGTTQISGDAFYGAELSRMCLLDYRSPCLNEPSIGCDIDATLLDQFRGQDYDEFEYVVVEFSDRIPIVDRIHYASRYWVFSDEQERNICYDGERLLFEYQTIGLNPAKYKISVLGEFN
jgi:hypothetical protein